MTRDPSKSHTVATPSVVVLDRAYGMQRRLPSDASSCTIAAPPEQPPPADKLISVPIPTGPADFFLSERDLASGSPPPLNPPVLNNSTEVKRAKPESVPLTRVAVGSVIPIVPQAVMRRQSPSRRRSSIGLISNRRLCQGLIAAMIAFGLLALKSNILVLEVNNLAPPSDEDKLGNCEISIDGTCERYETDLGPLGGWFDDASRGGPAGAMSDAVCAVRAASWAADCGDGAVVRHRIARVGVLPAAVGGTPAGMPTSKPTWTLTTWVKELERLDDETATLDAAADAAATAEPEKLPSRRRFYDDDADDEDDDAAGRWRRVNENGAPPDDVPSWIPTDWAKQLYSSAVSVVKKQSLDEEEAAAADAAAELESDDKYVHRMVRDWESNVQQEWLFARAVGAAQEAWKRLSPKTEVRHIKSSPREEDGT